MVGLGRKHIFSCFLFCFFIEHLSGNYLIIRTVSCAVLMKFQSSLYLRIVTQICFKILPMFPPYEEILIASEIKYLNVLSSALSIQIWTLSSPSKSVGAQQRSGNIQRSWSWVLCHILGPCSWLPIIWTSKSFFLMNSWCKYMNMLLMWIIDFI